MSAKTGKPVVVCQDARTGLIAWEIQKPELGSMLAVCPDCGFEFDSDHFASSMVNDGGIEGRAYICPRCDARDAEEAKGRLRELLGKRVARARVTTDWNTLLLMLEEEMRPKERLSVDIVEAPGDMCGGSRFIYAIGRLPAPCPGCRSCR